MSMTSHEGGETCDRVPELTAHQIGATALGGNQPPAVTPITEILPLELSRESLHAQLPTTHVGYRDMVLGMYLTNGVESATVNIKALESQFNAWFTPAKLQPALEWSERDPSVRFVLTATPNITVDAIALHGLTKLFSKNPKNELPLDSIYRQQLPAVLCGAIPDSPQPLKFSLVATNYYPTPHKQMDKQISQVKALQLKQPGVHVPSALEAVTYIRTLNALGVQLNGRDVFDLTATRHIDAELKRDADSSGWRGRPFTLVNMDGQYSLGASSIKGLAGLRLSFS